MRKCQNLIDFFSIKASHNIYDSRISSNIHLTSSNKRVALSGKILRRNSDRSIAFALSNKRAFVKNMRYRARDLEISSNFGLKPFYLTSKLLGFLQPCQSEFIYTHIRKYTNASIKPGFERDETQAPSYSIAIISGKNCENRKANSTIYKKRLKYTSVHPVNNKNLLHQQMISLMRNYVATDEYKYKGSKIQGTTHYGTGLHELNLLLAKAVCKTSLDASQIEIFIETSNYHGAFQTFRVLFERNDTLLKKIQSSVLLLLSEDIHDCSKASKINYIDLFKLFLTTTQRITEITKKAISSMMGYISLHKTEHVLKDLLGLCIKFEDSMVIINYSAKRAFLNAFRNDIDSLNYSLRSYQLKRPYTELIVTTLCDKSKNQFFLQDFMVYLYINHNSCFYQLSSPTMLAFFKNLDSKSLPRFVLSWTFYISKEQLSEEMCVVIYRALANIGNNQLKLANSKYKISPTRKAVFKSGHSATTLPYTKSDMTRLNKHDLSFDFASTQLKMLDLRNANYDHLLPIDIQLYPSLNSISLGLITYLYDSEQKVSIRTLNTYLHSYLSTLHPLSLIKGSPNIWFYYFEKFGVKPNTTSWTIVLNCLVSRNQYRFAFKLFNMMKSQKGSFPLIYNIQELNNFRTFTTTESYSSNLAISQSSKIGLSHEKRLHQSGYALKCKESAQKENLISGMGKNLASADIKNYLGSSGRFFKRFSMLLPPPNSVTYSIIIRFYAEQNDIRNAFATFQEMESKQILPTSRLIITCVCALANNGKLSDALELWVKYKSYENRADSSIKPTISQVLNKNDIGGYHEDNKSSKFLNGASPMISDFLLARRVLSKLVTSIINNYTSVEEFMYLGGLFGIKRNPLGRYNNQAYKLDLCLCMIAEFDREFPRVLNGSSGATVFNSLLKFAIATNEATKVKNVTQSSPVVKPSEIRISETPSDVAGLNNQQAKSINYILKLLSTRRQMNILLNVGTFSIILSKLTSFVYLSQPNSDLENALVNFFALKSDYCIQVSADFKNTNGKLFEDQPHSSLDYEPQAIGSSEPILKPRLKSAVNRNRNKVTYQAEKNNMAEPSENNQNKYNLRHRYAALSFYTVYNMELANITFDCNALVHAMPPILLLGKNSRSLDILWASIIRQTGSEGLYTAFEGITQENNNPRTNLNPVGSPKTALSGTGPGKSNSSNDNNDKKSLPIIKHLIDSGVKWGVKPLVLKWISQNLGPSYLNNKI